MSDILPVPIEDIVEPAQTPVAFLPWLAVHYGVRLWFPDWPEALKRFVVDEAPAVSFIVGTRAAVPTLLAYVDAALIDAKAYPQRFVFGSAIIGRTSVRHPPFMARYLVQVETSTPRMGFVYGRAVLGHHAGRAPSREKFRRARAALRAAKSPETEYRVSFQHKRQITIADAIPLDGTYALGQFISRTRL
jgi:P2-related tail formation protein